jgi:ribose/xylose/arabinose/galactoside ABC-type transport system permease subunit
VIASGCDQLEIQNSTQDIMIGIIIIAAVTLDQYRQRSTQR